MKKRVLSLALAVLMALSLLPTAASASTGGKTADDAINWVRGSPWITTAHMAPNVST